METQIAQFRYRRGDRKDLPTLAVGEPGLALDTNELFVGSTSGNLKVAQDVDVNKVKAQLEEMYFETATGTGNAILLKIGSQSAISDFKGKVSGNTTTNGNIGKFAYTTSLLAPSGAWNEMASTSSYDRLYELDGTLGYVSVNVNGSIPQQLFSFDIIRLMQDKFGDSIWQGKTALADKIAIAQQLITNIKFNWWGRGSSPTGNKSTIKRWLGTSSWFGTTNHVSGNVINLSSSITSAEISSGKGIDTTGFSHFMAHAEASNGTVASVINTDYVSVELTIVATPPNGYIRNFVASANNNGTATTINGIPVYKPGTTDTPVFVKDNAYTLYYNESRRIFYATASSDRFVKDGGNVATIQAGLRTARPSSLAGGGIYIATDTQETYSYDGTAWKVVGRSPYTTATETADGLMSKDDKKNLRLVQEGVTSLNGITDTHRVQIEQAQTDINTNKTNLGNLANLDQKIKDGKADGDLVKALNYAINYLYMGDIKNLVPTQNPEGTTITINWSNPTSNDFVKAEIFMSKTDITNFDYASCVSNANVTKVVDEKVTTKSIVSPIVGKHYFRAFATYNVFEATRRSPGISANITTSDQLPPGVVTGLAGRGDDTKVTLNWTNPTDVDFAGVKVMRKVGSYPTNQTDGTMVSNTATNTLVDTSVTNGTVYYYRLFPYDVNGNYNTTATGQQISVTPAQYKIYGVRIDRNDPNPSTRVVYIDDAVGKTPAPTGGGNTADLSFGSWKDAFPFNQIKPCVVKGNTATLHKYLNPNDLSKYTDGTSSQDEIWGTAGGEDFLYHTMMEIPKVYYSITNDTNYVYVRICDRKVNSNYVCLAHTSGSVEKDLLYLGCFLSASIIVGSTTYLQSRANAVVNMDLITTIRPRIKNLNSAYELMSYNQLVLLQALFVILYKSTDSQTALGRGYTFGNNAVLSTGTNLSKGLNYGTTSSGNTVDRVSFLGLEDMWGNETCYVDGILKENTNSVVKTSTGDYSNTAGYRTIQTNYPTTSGFIKDVSGTNDLGFLATSSVASSSTTYYCDNTTIGSEGLGYITGRYDSDASAGIFNFTISPSTSTSRASRIALLK